MNQQPAKQLNNHPIVGKCVLYVMSRDRQVTDNFALLIAQETAITHKVPLAVVFCLQPYDPTLKNPPSRKYYHQILYGLKAVESELATKNIPFMILIGKSSERLGGMIHHTQPAAVYFENNSLRGPSVLHTTVAKKNQTAVFVVNNHTNLVESQYLQKHPHNWPGVVRTIDELADIIRDLID